MRYKLAFSYNLSSALTVTARAVPTAGPALTAWYHDDEVFFQHLDHAQLAPDEHARVAYAVMTAVTMPEMGICCEEVSLDPEQLQRLQLEHRLVA